MNKDDDYNSSGVSSKLNKDPVDAGLLSSVEPIEKCRATIAYIPVYNTNNSVNQGRGLIENIESATIELENEALQLGDTGINDTTKLSKNKPMIIWPDHTKLKHVNGALLTIIFFVFIQDIIYFLYPEIDEALFIMIPFFSDIEKEYKIQFQTVKISMITLYAVVTVSGQIISTVCDMSFLAMTLAAMVIRHYEILIILITHHIIFDYVCSWYSEFLEAMMLIIGCLEFNIVELRWAGVVTVLKLAFLPQIAQTLAVMLVVHFVWPEYINTPLKKLLWVNFAGINSVLFMSSLKKLKHLGYFNTNNIYTVLDAASTSTDIAAVFFNYVLISVLLNTPKLNSICENCGIIESIDFKHVAREITIDIAFGILWGIIIVAVTYPYYSIQYNTQVNRSNNDQDVGYNKVQMIYLITTALSVVLFIIGGLLTAKIKYFFDCIPSHSLSCGISALVAGNSWRYRERNLYHINILTTTNRDENEYLNLVDVVLKVFRCIWKHVHPLLFGFMGLIFKMKYFNIWMLLFVPLGIVFQLVIRILITTYSVWGSGFNRYEVLFISIAWLPNFNLLALSWIIDLYFDNLDINIFFFLSEIVNCTIISYFMTSILGSWAVSKYGPTLLSQ